MMMPEEIERILNTFRGWLESHDPDGVPPRAEASLLQQFIALRHEVNLQTKASRALAEQSTKLLERIETLSVPKPVIKAFLDFADALAVSEKRMRMLHETVEPLLESLTVEDLPPRPSPGLFGRLSGAEWRYWADEVTKRNEARREASAAAAEKLLDIARSAADGYAMTLRRIERALPELGLEPIECVGQPFDPETMEVVEAGGDGAPGIVAEEIRRGYKTNGTVIRFAQVRVPR